MTPAARIAAAAEVLDDILSGKTAEQSLSSWSRRSRFAGSKDRAALRDLVFDALRCRRSFAALGGAETGRGLMIGALRAKGHDPADIFTGDRFAPGQLSKEEANAGHPPTLGAEGADIPDWLWPVWQASLGERAGNVAEKMKARAPVHLRVNVSKISRAEARELLIQEDIQTEPHSAAKTALEVVSGARKIRNSRAYLEGFVELQDAASQAIAEIIGLTDGMRVLDYCAGGGGKSLAMAEQAKIEVCAHDKFPRRMSDLPNRAKRAGTDVTLVTTNDLPSLGSFDLVLCDAPCSGSGSWRRDPEGKWNLTEDGLTELTQIQAEILSQAQSNVAQTGILVYATCSVLNVENQSQVERFIRKNTEWSIVSDHQWTPLDNTDGFYCARINRAQVA